jgi:YVTN family beta-propeller protein
MTVVDPKTTTKQSRGKTVKLLGWPLLGFGCLALSCLLMARAPADRKEPDGLRLRRPIALVLADGGNTLLVANRDSGTISIVDTRTQKVVSERRLGRRLSDLAATAKGDLLLAADEEAGEVVLVEHRPGSLRELRRLRVGASPVSVRVSDDGRRATVACLWPRQLWVLDLASPTREPGPIVLDLPFAPRRQLLLPGGTQLLVADSFGSSLALVDLRQPRVERVRQVASVHNIRGLALDHARKNVLLTHQTLYASGHATSGEIQAGGLIANELCKLSLDVVANPVADLMREQRSHPLGDVALGAGDPADVAETEDGETLVAQAGVHEVAIGRPDQALWTRLTVGQRPTALAVDPGRKRAYVANTFSDSISVIDLQAHKVVGEVPLTSAPVEPRAAERGEMLFYNARLSFESWFSCHSCHTDGHSNGRLNDNLSDGTLGTPKRVLSLLGVKDTGPWAWNGKVTDLEAQIRSSLRSTMHGRAPTAEQVADLAAYLQTLSPPPSVAKARGRIDATARERGRRVFDTQKCGHCHQEGTYTSPHTYDVGLRDEAGLDHFNPPSLRGLSQAGPYFHDSRASTLAEVFTHYRHRLTGDLSGQELGDLLAFLEGL